MSFNIFDFPKNSDVNVGYIDPTLGYVSGVSICDANEYARKNPGTTFIFETRDGIRYLNINEVNKLTPKDLASSADTCTGIEVEGQADYPSVVIAGCGGVGAAGNPVFGRDGSLLAIDLVSGGFGYQCPPLVEVRDETGLGVGAVTRAVLVGDPEYSDCKFVDTEEVFDQEDDFEEYQICDPTDDGYGTRYDAEGKPIGRWDPNLYANLSKDPIAREIQKYQDFLQQLSTPWWSTRKENPLRVTSGNRTTRIKHDVQHPGWGGEYEVEQGENFKEVTFKVFTSGGQDKGLALKFTSADKSHTFKIKADDFKNDETGQRVTKKVKINTIYNISSEGSFRGKGTEKGVISALGRNAKEKNPTGKEVVISGNAIFADFLESSNDNDDLQVEATLGKFTSKQIGKGSGRSNFDLKYELRDNSSYTKPAKIDDSFMNKYAISPVPPSNAPGSDFAGEEFTLEWEENFPYDGEYIFRAQADNIGRYYLDNEKLIETTQFRADQTPKVAKKNVKAGVHRIRVDLYNVPITQTSAPKSKNVFNTIDYLNKADRKLWRLDPRAGRDAGFINQYGVLPFNPNSDKAQTESFVGTHVIRWEFVEFPVDGNYNIEIMVDDNVTLYIGNREGGGAKEIGNGLRSVEQGGDEVIIRKVGYSSPGKSTGKSFETRFFKAGKYRIRAELEQIDVGPLSKGNPMALAINIETTVASEPVVSAKSWNENPMGAALTIDAPVPPIPQEPIPLQEGRCPRNPIWTTRFPGGKEKWWPVKFENVDGPSWSRFMNRYAISPIPPLAKPGSDGGGVVYRNSWDIDIPYDGFYAFKSTVDNAGRILIDGNPVMQANYIPTTLENTRGGSGSERRSGISAIGSDGIIYNWRENNPKSKKIFLSKGLHKIEIEVENGKTNTYEKIDKKIFSTKDWLFPPKSQTQTTTTPGTGSVTREEWVKVDDAYVPPTTFLRSSRITIPPNASFHQYLEGTYYKGKRIRNLGDWNDTNPNTNYIEWDKDTRLTLGSYHSGRFGIKVWQKRTVASQEVKITTEQTAYTREGVTYSGPQLMKFNHPRWSSYFNKFSVSPYFPDLDSENPEILNEFVYTWSNVKFPESTQYEFSFLSDNTSEVFIDGVKVLNGNGFNQNGDEWRKVNITEGLHTIQVKVINLPGGGTNGTIFRNNPTGLLLRIRVPRLLDGDGASWKENPIGVSAALVAPPCPKPGGGVGIVTSIIPIDPGNGYIPVAGNNTYNVGLELQEIIPVDPGRGYELGPIDVEGPAQAEICEIGPNGEILKVCVSPGLGYVDYPSITVPAENPGYNAVLVPVFKVIRDPIFIDQDKLVQVTDLAGLKQTGYVFGRPYYGAVFYKDGTRYAGYYETAGEFVQVYDTLKESIDSQVTTAPSAIQRQGTDISSNDPRLNIPNTPSNGVNFN